MPRHKCIKPYSNWKCSKKLIEVKTYNKNKLEEILKISLPTKCYICISCKINFDRKTNLRILKPAESPNESVNNSMEASTSQAALYPTMEMQNVPSDVPEQHEKTTPFSSTSSSNINSDPQSSPEPSLNNTFTTHRKLLVENLNKFILPLLNMEKIDVWKLSSEKYINKTLEAVNANMKANFILNVEQEAELTLNHYKEKSKYLDEIIHGWEEKFPSATIQEKQKLIFCRLNYNKLNSNKNRAKFCSQKVLKCLVIIAV